MVREMERMRKIDIAPANLYNERAVSSVFRDGL